MTKHEEESKSKADICSRNLLKLNDHIYELFSIKIIMDCYYLYYKIMEGSQSKKLRKFVLPLQLKLYKTMNKMDSNLFCDINDLLLRITTKSLIRQLVKLGVLYYINSTKIPDNFIRGLKKELEQLKKSQKEFKRSQVYA